VDLVQKRQQLRQKQVEKVKKFRQSNQSSSAAVEKQNEREQMKKEVRKEIENENQNESISIDNSDGVTFARVMDIVGPTHMKPLVSGGLWKGTEQISEKMEEDDDTETDNQQQKQVDSKQKKADQIKKQVLLKKLQAVRQGGGSEIMASYDWRSELADSIAEARKSGDASLHDWFNKSKSSDGTKGWVQAGGKFAGKPCAKQEGQKTKPKCISSKMKRSMSKDEEEAAHNRKNRKDTNPDRSGKAINVSTFKKKKVKEEVDVTAVAKELDKASKMHKGQANKLRKHADEMKEEKKPKNCGCGKDPCITYGNGKKEKIDEACWKGYEKKGMKKMFGKMYPNCVKKTKKEEVELTVEGKGEKDACYSKVKSRYKVWPSAYASGALVKCRKVGADNWGNKTKKESYSWRDELDYVKEGAAWTKKAGKNKEGGLNEKGRKSYERENPGSDLKAPQPEGGSRKKSFCARMGGMKKKLTSSKTANDPDSRINKALRKWKC